MPETPPIPADLSRPADAPGDEEITDAQTWDAQDGPPPSALAFRVNDDRAAEWAMRKLVAIEAEAKGQEAKAAAWRAEVDAWEARVIAPLQHSHRYFEGLLCDYQRRRREADEKAKTLVLPSGEVASTRQAAGKPKPAVVDEGAYVEWALARWRADPSLPPLFIAKPSQAALKEAAAIKPGVGVFVEGEAVPGTVIEPGKPAGMRFEVKAGRP